MVNRFEFRLNACKYTTNNTQMHTQKIALFVELFDGDDCVQCVENIFVIVRFCCFIYVQILLMNEEITSAELDFFLRFPIKPHVTSPVDFLSNTSWGGVCTLSAKEEFR